MQQCLRGGAGCNKGAVGCVWTASRWCLEVENTSTLCNFPWRSQSLGRAKEFRLFYDLLQSTHQKGEKEMPVVAVGVWGVAFED